MYIYIYTYIYIYIDGNPSDKQPKHKVAAFCVSFPLKLLGLPRHRPGRTWPWTLGTEGNGAIFTHRNAGCHNGNPVTTLWKYVEIGEHGNFIQFWSDTSQDMIGWTIQWHCINERQINQMVYCIMDYRGISLPGSQRIQWEILGISRKIMEYHNMGMGQELYRMTGEKMCVCVYIYIYTWISPHGLMET